MAREAYSDRKDWPRYRGGIRQSLAILGGAVVGALLVTVVQAPLLTPIDQKGRVAVERLLVGLMLTLCHRLFGPR